MTDRYKKIVIDNEYTRGIYIFVGNLKKDFDVTYKRNQDDKKFNDIITADMKRIIKKMDGDIYFIGDIIYDDDTISNIKKKIIAGTELPIVYDELYLFSKNDYHVEDSQLYKILSNNIKQRLSKLFSNKESNKVTNKKQNFESKEILNYIKKHHFVLNKYIQQLKQLANHLSNNRFL